MTADHRTTLSVASLGTFLVLVAYTTPMGAIASTFAGLGVDVAGGAWVIASMSIGLSATLIAAGALADRFGRRRAFIGGALTLAAGSLLAAAAPSATIFIAARIVQGIGGAALTSSSLGLLGHTFSEPAARAQASAIWAASLGAGIAVGPLVAASFDVAGHWRFVHVLTAIIAVGAVVAARSLSESRAAIVRTVDVAGTVLFAVGSSSLLAGLVMLRTGTPSTGLAVVVGGVVGLVAFGASQTRPAAMLPVSLFKRADFVAATVGAVSAGLGIIALTSVLPVMLARGAGRSSIDAALLSLVWSAATVTSSTLARRLPLSWASRSRLTTALFIVGGGQLLLGLLDVDSGTWRYVPGLLISGVGTGLLNATLGREAVASVPAGQAALGSGANNTARYLAAAFGMTIASLVMGTSSGAEAMARWNIVVGVTASSSVLGALVVSRCRWT
ncbi:MAG TPA: MFS transporter [Myxococcota bacterium]